MFGFLTRHTVDCNYFWCYCNFFSVDCDFFRGDCNFFNRDCNFSKNQRHTKPSTLALLMRQHRVGENLRRILAGKARHALAARLPVKRTVNRFNQTTRT